MLVAKTSRPKKTKFGFQMFWKCACDCGGRREVRASSLTMKKVRSCGCDNHSSMNGNESRLSHGDARHTKVHKLWRAWAGMRSRCRNKRDVKNWRIYGGRGIKVCQEWSDYPTFKKWALSSGYRPSLSLDRINTNGDYEPSNCRWATKKQQMNNRRKFGTIECFSDADLLAEISIRGLA